MNKLVRKKLLKVFHAVRFLNCVDIKQNGAPQPSILTNGKTFESESCQSKKIVNIEINCLVLLMRNWKANILQ